jgi:GAF domain-containing protein
VRPRGTASGPVGKGHRAFRPKARKARRPKASTPDLQELVAALTRELQEAREQQTATSEVLQIISSSSGKLEPVFQAMLANATRLCGAEFAIMFRVDEGVALPLARFGVPAPIMEFIVKRGAIRPNESAPIMRAVKTKRVVHVVDYRKDQAYIERDPFAVFGVEIAGVRTLLIVPMLKDGQSIGTINIFRKDVRPFTQKQIELVTNFAKQAVIAFESTRLLNELRQRTDDLSEALERQTATTEVLKVISSSPGELEPVFNAMLANATRICEAAFGVLLVCEGTVFRSVAIHSNKGHADS